MLGLYNAHSVHAALLVVNTKTILILIMLVVLFVRKFWGIALMCEQNYYVLATSS
jgi:hypothetical protein